MLIKGLNAMATLLSFAMFAGAAALTVASVWIDGLTRVVVAAAVTGVLCVGIELLTRYGGEAPAEEPVDADLPA